MTTLPTTGTPVAVMPAFEGGTIEVRTAYPCVHTGGVFYYDHTPRGALRVYLTPTGALCGSHAVYREAPDPLLKYLKRAA